MYLQQHTKGNITLVHKISILVCTFLIVTLSSYNIGNKSVPFCASLQTSIQILGTPPIQPVRSSGSGVATHMGQVTFEGNATVNFTTLPPSINGVATFTAANGDQFYTSFSGSTSIINGEAIGNFTHEITGGTGRFSTISGTLTAHSVHPIGAPTGSLNLEGSIDY